VGAYFAIETGPETSTVLKMFLDSLKSKGVRVNLDPANLVMVTGDDPVQAVFNLKDYIVHTHAKDGIMLRRKNPEIIYGMIEDAIQSEEAFREVPLGEGSVDFHEYLKALDSIGYSGFLTIEREVGDNPEKDIRTAVEFLNRTIYKINN
jgi:sugar phosphate isomerase/epimerase